MIANDPKIVSNNLEIDICIKVSVSNKPTDNSFLLKPAKSVKKSACLQINVWPRILLGRGKLISAKYPSLDV